MLLHFQSDQHSLGVYALPDMHCLAAADALAGQADGDSGQEDILCRLPLRILNLSVGLDQQHQYTVNMYQAIAILHDLFSIALLSQVRPASSPSFCAVQAVLSKLAALDADLSEKRAKKNRLESEVRMCSIKLDRAQKLISGLGGEKSRWTAAAALLGQQLQRLTGDVLLAAAQIAYLGEPVLCDWVQQSLQNTLSTCGKHPALVL